MNLIPWKIHFYRYMQELVIANLVLQVNLKPIKCVLMKAVWASNFMHPYPSIDDTVQGIHKSASMSKDTYTTYFRTTPSTHDTTCLRLAPLVIKLMEPVLN